MRCLLVLLLLLLTAGAWAQDRFVGTVSRRSGDQLTVRSLDGKDSEDFFGSELPDWVQSGAKVRVDYQPVRVAVKENGQRICKEFKRVVKITRFESDPFQRP